MMKHGQKQTQLIFLVCGKNPLTTGSGYASYTYNLASTLTTLGYDVTIFCCGRQAQQQMTPIGKLIVVESAVLGWPVFHHREMAALVWLSFRIGQAINQASPPAVIWGVGPWALAGILSKKHNHATLIADYFTTLRHEYRPTIDRSIRSIYGFWHWLANCLMYFTVIQAFARIESYLLRHVDQIIVHYQSTKHVLDQEIGTMLPIHMLPYAVALTPKIGPGIQAQPTITKRPLVLIISRHDERKGIAILLQALVLLQTKKIAYQVISIGVGKRLSDHKKLAQKLGLKNMQFLGFVPEVKPYLIRASVYVSPAIEEGSGSVSVVEAMSCGLPIIATNIDGIPEDLVDRKSALLVEPNNPRVLAEAIEKLLTNRVLAQKLGHQAFIQYQRRFDQKTIQRALTDFLSGLSVKVER